MGACVRVRAGMRACVCARGRACARVRAYVCVFARERVMFEPYTSASMLSLFFFFLDRCV